MSRPAVVLSLAFLAATAGAAEPPELLKPMSFLAGHCWKGAFPDSSRTDEHCFAWMYGGQVLRDTHTVREPGKPDYVGETTYYVDSVARRVEYLYVENSGGSSRGSVASDAGALLFPDGRYTEDGQAMAYRARWTRQGDQAYEAWSEAQTPKGWATMIKLVMRRVD
jgi:hypothetical protein